MGVPGEEAGLGVGRPSDSLLDGDDLAHARERLPVGDVRLKELSLVGKHAAVEPSVLPADPTRRVHKPQQPDLDVLAWPLSKVDNLAVPGPQDRARVSPGQATRRTDTVRTTTGRAAPRSRRDRKSSWLRRQPRSLQPAELISCPYASRRKEIQRRTLISVLDPSPSEQTTPLSVGWNSSLQSTQFSVISSQPAKPSTNASSSCGVLRSLA